MLHSHLNDMEIPETKRFIPKGFELGTTVQLAEQVYVDNNDDNDNKQNKSKIAALKNIKLPPTFRATRQVDRVGQHFERGGEGNRRHNKGFL